MNMKASVIAATLAAFCAASGAALAADEPSVAAKPATTDSAKGAQSVQQAPAVKKAKPHSPHSHVAEKTGATPAVSPAPTAEEKARKDKMHQHQRDAK